MLFRSLEMGVFAKVPATVAPVVVMNLEPSLSLHYAQLAAQLREAGINTEVYGPDDKLGKQRFGRSCTGVRHATILEGFPQVEHDSRSGAVLLGILNT